MRVLLIKPETIGIFAYTNLVDHISIRYLKIADTMHIFMTEGMI